MKISTLRPELNGQHERASVIHAPQSPRDSESGQQTNQLTGENPAATHLDLTLDICAEDGSRTRFYQNGEVSVSKTLLQLATPRLFSQPLYTLASEHSVSAIPCRTVDLILAHTESAPPLLPLPVGWLDAVEVSGEALPEKTLAGESPAVMNKEMYLLEIHTVGDWMIRLNLEIAKQATLSEQRQLLAHFIDLPVIPFRLEAGGIGFINPSKISRVTVYPPVEGITETALQADLLQCIRS
jgi:hypothetical protein